MSEGTPLGTTYQRLGLPDPATPESDIGPESIQDSVKTVTQAETSTPVMTSTLIPDGIDSTLTIFTKGCHILAQNMHPWTFE